MGNSESSSQFPSREEDDGGDQGYDARKVLKAGAAVAGTALLALGALKLASSSTSDDTQVGEYEGGGGGGSWDHVQHESYQRPRRREPNPYDLVGEYGSGGGGGGGIHGHLQSYQLPRGREPNPDDLGDAHKNVGSRTIKIMTYNIWSREDIEVHERMKAIGCLIQQHSPDVVFFQEVTPKIYQIIQSSRWWEEYECSVPPDKATRPYFCMMLSKPPVEFKRMYIKTSTMARELCVAEINGMDKKLVAATIHLKSPHQAEMHSEERVAQARQAIGLLQYRPNVIFGGDMNWDDEEDGPFPRPYGWVDAWESLRPTEKGWTFDTKTNPVLRGRPRLQKRLDRFVCRLRDFRMVDVEMIGKEAITGISYKNKSRELPVLPSDHYGLILTICTK